MASVSFISTSKLIDLLAEADPRKALSIRVLSTTRLALGADPLQPSKIIDLSREVVAPFDDAKSERPAAVEKSVRIIETATIKGPPRRSGDYYLEVKSQTIECKSLKELLAEGLRALEAHHSGTLEQLSAVRRRSRRIVSRDPRKLFGEERLSKKFSEKLFNGWWYGTNNSAAATKIWLQMACEIAGLKWGTDFNTSL